MIPTLKARGHRGSWFAEVDGEWLACVHKHWWPSGKEHLDPNARPGDPQFEELVAAIRQLKRVIVTEDDVFDGGTRFTRTGYVGIFEVDHISFSQSGLSFTFVKKLANLK